MQTCFFPVIDLAATGANIRRLRIERGLTVRDLQSYFGFEEPQAIYKWQAGKSLPTVDNLYALSVYLGVPMDSILVPKAAQLHTVPNEPQATSCGSLFLHKCCSFFTGAQTQCLLPCYNEATETKQCPAGGQPWNVNLVISTATAHRISGRSSARSKPAAAV